FAGAVAYGGTLVGSDTSAALTDSDPERPNVIYATGGVEVNAFTREFVQSTAIGADVGAVGAGASGSISGVILASRDEAAVSDSLVRVRGDLNVLANNTAGIPCFAGSGGAHLAGAGT